MLLHFNFEMKGKVAKDIVAEPYEWRGENALHRVHSIYGPMDLRSGHEESLIRCSRSDERRSGPVVVNTDYVDARDNEHFRRQR